MKRKVLNYVIPLGILLVSIPIVWWITNSPITGTMTGGVCVFAYALMMSLLYKKEDVLEQDIDTDDDDVRCVIKRNFSWHGSAGAISLAILLSLGILGDSLISGTELRLPNIENVSIGSANKVDIASILNAEIGSIEKAEIDNINNANVGQIDRIDADVINEVNVTEIAQINATRIEEINATEVGEINITHAEQVNISQADEVNISEAGEVNIGTVIGDVNIGTEPAVTAAPVEPEPTPAITPAPTPEPTPTPEPEPTPEPSKINVRFDVAEPNYCYGNTYTFSIIFENVTATPKYYIGTNVAGAKFTYVDYVYVGGNIKVIYNFTLPSTGMTGDYLVEVVGENINVVGDCVIHVET